MDKWRLINGTKLYNIQEDPGQIKDVSDKFPTILQDMKEGYEKWWQNVSTRFDEYCSIILGYPNEKTICLMSHDIHGQVVFSHNQVKRGERTDGFWAVEIIEDGIYEFSLRRWPKEVNKPISYVVSADNDKPQFNFKSTTTARLKIADYDQSKPVNLDDSEVKFQVNLKEGDTRVQAWFINGMDDGQTQGVYYVYVEKIDS